MIRNFFYCAATLALAGGAFAQIPAPLDIQIALNGTAVLPLNGDADNVEFDGVAVTPSASIVYVFDSVSTFDGLFTSVGPAVFATEAQLSGGGTSASAGDMDADANNIYVGIFDGSKQRITRIPHTGFAGAAEMVDSSGILSVNIDEINVDAKNARLMMNYNDAFGAAAEDIVHVPLNATSAAPTLWLPRLNLRPLWPPSPDTWTTPPTTSTCSTWPCNRTATLSFHTGFPATARLTDRCCV